MHERCVELFEKISEYLDGELDSDTCREIEAHFLDCPECLDCFETLKKTVGLCKKFPREEVPSDAKQRLRAVLKELLQDQPQ